MNEPGMVHGLTAENILKEFPVSLRDDPSVAALGDVTARLLARRPAEINRLLIYPMIDQLPEKLLDILAYDFKVDWWDPNYTVEEKRRTLKSSWHVHKILGTKAAVETAIRDIYPKTDVQEWFEYGGDPYHFKLYIDLTGERPEGSKPENVIERVNYYKSLRSHLDSIQYTIEFPPATLHVGGGVGAAVNMGVPAAGDTFSFRQTLSMGGALGAGASIGVPEERDTFDFQHVLSAGGTFGAEASAGVPERADTPEFSHALHTGGVVSGLNVLPVPENTAPPPSTTILRTGGIFTIISNRSEGD